MTDVPADALVIVLNRHTEHWRSDRIECECGRWEWRGGRAIETYGAAWHAHLADAAMTEPEFIDALADAVAEQIAKNPPRSCVMPSREVLAVLHRAWRPKGEA
jgi:hypothetical protein